MSIENGQYPEIGLEPAFCPNREKLELYYIFVILSKIERI
jgi:hypothetical protein